MIYLWIILGAIVLWFISTFNSMVTTRNRVREAWADIDVQLKRRYDLIPNLVETVKGYASHEREALERVVSARTKAMQAGSVPDKVQAENQLSGALRQLFALSEAYPDLKASQNFVELQKELTDTEDKIQASRRFFNNMVLELNNKIERFPTNFIASWLNFKKEVFFQLGNEAEREPVKVSF